MLSKLQFCHEPEVPLPVRHGTACTNTQSSNTPQQQEEDFRHRKGQQLNHLVKSSLKVCPLTLVILLAESSVYSFVQGVGVTYTVVLGMLSSAFHNMYLVPPQERGGVGAASYNTPVPAGAGGC